MDAAVGVVAGDDELLEATHLAEVALALRTFVQEDERVRFGGTVPSPGAGDRP